MTKKKIPKIPKKYFCDICDYNTSNRKDYDKHKLTLKHKIRTNTNEKVPKIPKAYLCECGKSYKHASSLWNHKQRCFLDKNRPVLQETGKSEYKELLAQAMTHIQVQNEELKKKDVLINNMIHKIGNNNTTNTVNINMFLNDKCKNALNFSEFINKIEVSTEDLENNAQLGFVDGITKILMDNLQQLTLFERPIHCTDIKRETLYIKDNNIWKTDNETILDNGIQEVSRKSLSSLLQWKKENPDYENMDSDFSNKCIVIQKQSTALSNKHKMYPKVRHNIARKNYLKKTCIQ